MSKPKLTQERTLVLIKPDVLQRQIVGEIISRFERKGVKLTAIKMVNATKEQVGEHYEGKEAYLIETGEKAKKGAIARGEDPTVFKNPPSPPPAVFTEAENLPIPIANLPKPSDSLPTMPTVFPMMRSAGPMAAANPANLTIAMRWLSSIPMKEASISFAWVIRSCMVGFRSSPTFWAKSRAEFLRLVSLLWVVP